jgi:hypothetical protein
MLIYEKVKETTAHLPSDRPIKKEGLCFFLANGKYFFNTEKLILGEGEFSISAEKCRNKIFFF